MRLIGQIADKSHAERFTSFLLTRSIATHCEEAGDQWEVWIRDEDQIETAKNELEKFRANPDGETYRESVVAAALIARQKAIKEKQIRKQQVDMTTRRWNAPIHKVAPLTVTLILISFLVGLMTQFGQDRDGFAMRALAFSSLTSAQLQAESSHPEVIANTNYSVRLRTYSLRHLELWRTVTPIFIHFGGWHFIFNMYWLVFFGRQIEMRYGSSWLLTLILLVAIPACVSGAIMPESLSGSAISVINNQAILLAGGMSGVVYGLLGYVLVKMFFDEKSGLFISTANTVIMIAWLFACMTPTFQNWLGANIDNWAHGVGLLVGLAIGYVPKLLGDIGLKR
jgi:GlpG protein